MLRLSQIEKLAELYESAPEFTFSAPWRCAFDTYVNGLFRKIEVPVTFVYDGQPFQTSGQQWRHVRRFGYLPIFAAPHALGMTYAKHRAVHDWFGHILPELPFGVEGELTSYRIHARQYPRAFHPFLFSDVVLANAFFEARGDWFPFNKVADVNPEEILRHV